MPKRNRDQVPVRIQRVRQLCEVDPWGVPRWRVREAALKLRTWLADPEFPEAMKQGGPDLLADLEESLRTRPRNIISIVTREQLDREKLEAAMREAEGQTRH